MIFNPTIEDVAIDGLPVVVDWVVLSITNLIRPQVNRAPEFLLKKSDDYFKKVQKFTLL